MRYPPPVRSTALLFFVVAACASRQPAPHATRRRVVLSVVGTSDLHGRLAMLPWLGGHLANLRRARERDGAVLLVDAGDLFQGTLASNLDEGASVVRAYNALGYAAAAVGNHEFDYGPAGEDNFARTPEEDPRGALRARIREARFPFLAANIVDAASGATPAWENVAPTATVTVAGVRVGLVGVSTEATPHTTLTANFRGLAMRPLAETIRARAEALRRGGAAVVVVLAHAGGGCRRFDDPDDLHTCDPDEEIFQVARALPTGGVDVIVAGHTHRGVAHVVNGIPVVESFANGQAFGRVDLTVDVATGRVIGRRVFAPHNVCGRSQRDEPDPSACAPGEYEGDAVEPDRAVRDVVAPALEAARAVEARPLGVTVATALRSRYHEESPLANLVADMMHAAVPGADVAITNAGGVRADLGEGPLDYGKLYTVLPFDNRLVTVRMRASSLREALSHNAQDDGGTLVLSGLRAAGVCEGGRLAVRLTRDDGRPVGDDDTLTVATSDYLARGTFGRRLVEPLTDDAIVASPVLRDAVARAIGALGTVRGDDPRWCDPARPRIALPSPRPVRCS